MNGSFRKGFGIGCFGQIIILMLMAGAVLLTAELGDSASATVVSISFLPTLAVVGILFLLGLLIFAAIPSLRSRLGSVPGAVVGWLVGGVVVIAILAGVTTILMD